MYEIAFHTGVKAICDGGLVRFRRNEPSTDHIGDAVYLIGTLALGKADKYTSSPIPVGSSAVIPFTELHNSLLDLGGSVAFREETADAFHGDFQPFNLIRLFL